MTCGTRDRTLQVRAELSRSGIALLRQIHDLIFSQLFTRTQNLRNGSTDSTSYILLLFPLNSSPVGNMCLDARPSAEKLASIADEAAWARFPASLTVPAVAPSTAFTFASTTTPQLRRESEGSCGVPEGGDVAGAGNGGAAPPEAAALCPPYVLGFDCPIHAS